MDRVGKVKKTERKGRRKVAKEISKFYIHVHINIFLREFYL